ncbi:hypothetical protein PR202_ga15196 [Eleusine coracana subsp. coracana]|uniref:Uncharacterized protein n=1 Tax=Eleusine coracana subsp. coracana TaxID=191504 RepID=A0AAV5CIP5_ELECO|nr:hypothetical protein QOZ80_6BG0495770 [Eleusine coracana subsp. coracana]GJM98208.1 hypothetical protein PR202_ga15196 [Eleusine coracana subsp. coracana]
MERVQAGASAAATTAEAAEETMALYDACWFHRLVLLPSPLPPPPAPGPPAASQAPPPEPDHSEAQRPAAASAASPTAGARHRRTRSDELQQGLEPLQIPNNTTRAKLETILSGKDGMVAAPQPQPLPDRVRRPDASRRPARRSRRRGRSMSELEFEELKGLQDLGFTFSDAEVDAQLASIVPGLRRKLSGEVVVEPLLVQPTTASAPPATAAPNNQEEAAAAADPDDDSTRRPYLSEAWDDEEEEVSATLRNWRIPHAVDGADLKEHLRMWAHTVASAVR